MSDTKPTPLNERAARALKLPLYLGGGGAVNRMDTSPPVLFDPEHSITDAMVLVEDARKRGRHWRIINIRDGNLDGDWLCEVGAPTGRWFGSASPNLPPRS